MPNLAYMFQRNAEGPFTTSGSEKWPARTCQWLATLLAASCQHPANAAQREGVPATRDLPRLSAGRPLAHPGCANIWLLTRAITLEVASAHRGTGPTLPEAMRRERTGTGYATACESSSWLGEAELEREAFRVASGGAKGCALAGDEDLQAQLRALWKAGG